MTMKKLGLVLLVFLTLGAICPAAGLAANDVTRRGLFIEIIPDGTTDWDSLTDYPGGMVLEYVAFSPSAATDVFKLRESAATGPAMTPIVRGNTNLDASIMYPGGGLVHPYLKATDCTFGTAANVRIVLKIR
jgi:hypothetical protein